MKINKTKLFGIGLFILAFATVVIAQEAISGRTSPYEFLEVNITNGDGDTLTYTFPGLELYCKGYYKGGGECTQRDFDEYIAEETAKIENKVSPISIEVRLADIEQDITNLKANVTELNSKVVK